MTFPPVLAIGVLLNIVAVLFCLVCVFLILVVLIQKGRGGGLSGAFGGGMASGLLGSKTGDFLTWVTVVIVGVFLTLAVVLSKYYRPRVGTYGASTTTEQPAGTTEQPEAPAAQPAAPAQPISPPAAPTGQAPAQPPAEQPGATVPAPAPAPGSDANGSGK
jgi:preprotein translocase subunit SecG